MKQDDLTKLSLQEAKEDELRFKNMKQKVITDLCSPTGKSSQKIEEL